MLSPIIVENVAFWCYCSPWKDPPAPFQITEEQIQTLEEDGVVIIKGVSTCLCSCDLLACALCLFY